METVKEIVVDFFIVATTWFIVTASGLTYTAKGLTCGRVETSAQSHP